MAAILTIALVLGGIGVMMLLSGIALYNRLMTLRSLVRSARTGMEAIQQGGRQKLTSGQTAALDYALRTYNEAVWSYNTALVTFPANVMARWCGLEKEESLDTPGNSSK